MKLKRRQRAAHSKVSRLQEKNKPAHALLAYVRPLLFIVLFSLSLGLGLSFDSSLLACCFWFLNTCRSLAFYVPSFPPTSIAQINPKQNRKLEAQAGDLHADREAAKKRLRAVLDKVGKKTQAAEGLVR